MSDEPFNLCGACGGDIVRSVQAPRFNLGHSYRNPYEYRDDLARNATEIAADPTTPASWRPGMPDPQAFTDGERAVKKLLAQRQREGWQVREGGWATVSDSAPKMKSSEQLAREAYEAARAKGFRPDEED